MPILDIQRRMREVGRIRIGEQVANANGKGTHPAKLDAFRLTSQDEQVIRSAATIYGGEPTRWADAPAGEQWQVNTTAKAIDVIVPPVAYAFSQFYELWSGGGCQRRCDGITEMLSDSGCMCDADERECKPHSRLSLILSALEGFGVWRLDTQGWNAATELAGTIDVLEMLQGRGQMVPARLLLVQRTQRKPGQPTMKFAVPSLDLNIKVAEIVGTAATDRPALTPITPDETPAPSIAAQVGALRDAEPKPPRANAQAALPPSGRTRGTAVPGEVVEQSIAKDADDPPAPATGITQTQANRIRLQLSHVGIREDKDVYAKVGDWVGRKVTSLKQITKAEMDTVLTEIGKMPEAQAS